MEDMAELTLRRQADEALAQALRDPAKAMIARVAYQMIIDGEGADAVLAKIGEKRHVPKVDLAEKRRLAIETNFRVRWCGISIPKPDVSNTTLKRWALEGRELFYRPATAEVSYERWVAAHGQGKHWTVANEAERAKVDWENTAAGYWFTVETAQACPRLNTCWNDLSASASGIRLLSLEEYAIVYWTHRDLTGKQIDVSTWCWLRTRSGLGALAANGCAGEVRVRRFAAGGLSIPSGYEGGRAVEVVKNAV